MSASEDEQQQSLDSGWDDEPALSRASGDDEEDVDQAWDSLPPPVSAASGMASSMPPVTEAVDSGWDDMPEGAPQPGGKRRPHRQRRTKSNAAALASSPVLLPRPAEPAKKQQREHARKLKAHESQVKQQRKEERKAQRAAEMRQEGELRQRQTEAEALEREQRRAARERAERERPKPAKVTAPKPVRSVGPQRASTAPSSSAPRPSEPETHAVAAPDKAGKVGKAGRSAFRPGVVLTLLLLVGVAFLLLWRK